MTPENLAKLMIDDVRKSSAYVQYEADEEHGEQPDLTDILIDGHVDFVRLAKTVLSLLAQTPTGSRSVPEQTAPLPKGLLPKSDLT